MESLFNKPTKPSLITQFFKESLELQLESFYPSPDTETIKATSRRPTKPAPQCVQKIELDAQPIQEKNEAKVNAFDGRTQIFETAKWPNSVHGVIISKVNNITKWGTGILIGPHIVLTAGHNLYNYQHKTYTDVKSLQFLPGMNGKMLPFSVIAVEQYFVSPNYMNEGKEDYGILVLKEPVGEMTGYFGLACLEPEDITKKRINVTGYPGDKVADKSNTYEMWGMEGTASSIDRKKGQINYLIDTGAGQSGSGVWYQEGEDYYVCGVHVSGNQTVNTATLLTRAMYKQIHAWVQQAVCKEFLLRLRGKKELQFKNLPLNSQHISLLTKYNLDDLTILYFRRMEMGNEETKFLAQNTSWINLSRLNLSENDIGAEGAKALAQNNAWIKLSQLNLSENNIGAEGAKALAQNTSWIILSDLDLSSNHIDDEGGKALAQNTSWINLSHLGLRYNKIGAEGAKALAKNTSWINLSRLNLYHNDIGAEGAKALAQNNSWINLSQLNLSENNIGAEGAKALAQNTSWITLSDLDLSRNHIGAEGAKALAQNTSWINLSKVNLSTNNIDAEAVKALAQNTSWINLSRLDISSNKIDTEGAKSLAQNTSWITLSDLNLSHNNIDAEGVKVLVQNTSWTNLRDLTLYYNKIGAEEVKALTQNKTWRKDIRILT